MSKILIIEDEEAIADLEKDYLPWKKNLIFTFST